jgi:hypothetical protein
MTLEYILTRARTEKEISEIENLLKNRSKKSGYTLKDFDLDYKLNSQLKKLKIKLALLEWQ